jgi:hypothetical protein
MFLGLTKGLSGSAKTNTNVAPKGATNNAISAVVEMNCRRIIPIVAPIAPSNIDSYFFIE